MLYVKRGSIIYWVVPEFHEILYETGFNSAGIILTCNVCSNFLGISDVTSFRCRVHDFYRLPYSSHSIPWKTVMITYSTVNFRRTVQIFDYTAPESTVMIRFKQIWTPIFQNKTTQLQGTESLRRWQNFSSSWNSRPFMECEVS